MVGHLEFEHIPTETAHFYFIVIWSGFTTIYYTKLDTIINKLIALICLPCMQTSDKDKQRDKGCSIIIDATTPFLT